MESLGRIDQSDYDALIGKNREQYAVSIDDLKRDETNQKPQKSEEMLKPDQPPANASEHTLAGFELGEHEKL